MPPVQCTADDARPSSCSTRAGVPLEGAACLRSWQRRAAGRHWVVGGAAWTRIECSLRLMDHVKGGAREGLRLKNTLRGIGDVRHRTKEIYNHLCGNIPLQVGDMQTPPRHNRVTTAFQKLKTAGNVSVETALFFCSDHFFNCGQC